MGFMPKRYFDLKDDMRIGGRWLLGTPTDVHGREVDDPWMFYRGERLPELGALNLPVTVPGRALDFSRAAFAAPVVHARVASVLSELASEEVQTMPVQIEGQSEPFFILVATQLIQCIDERASRHIRKWTPEDGRPEKLGKYRDVRGMRIDSEQVGDAKIFRPQGWAIVLIVREDIKDALERMGATGTTFEEV
ncbi:imm11 family protein [Myxococcus eversor]|uniref:imm11 family protein n=1 Tax=Myxococcus eversor TaxID=2709661 RepID=UPI003084068F